MMLHKFLTILFLSVPILGLAQNPERFVAEYRVFDNQDSINSETDHYLAVDNLFVGSSSIRFWLSLSEDYPEADILNRGFGGSHMSDLWLKREELIYRYTPKRIFIYEGDNDIADGEEPAAIILEAQELVKDIFRHLPESDIYFISPKPSVARWSYAPQYIDLNNRMSQLALSHEQVHFIDVWTPMLEEDGKVMTDIFIHDDLHMNDKGYDIWRQVIAPYVK